VASPFEEGGKRRAEHSFAKGIFIPSPKNRRGSQDRRGQLKDQRKSAARGRIFCLAKM